MASPTTAISKHWTTLKSGPRFATAALAEWGPATSGDVTSYRSLFTDLPGRPLCSKPATKFQPNLRLSSLVSFVLELKNRVFFKMGIYVYTGADGKTRPVPTNQRYGPVNYRSHIPIGKWIPCTSIALMHALGNWIWQMDIKGPKGSARASARQLKALTAYMSYSQELLNSEATKRKIKWGSTGYETLAKAIILPASKVNGFWQLCQAIALRKDTAGFEFRSWKRHVLDFTGAAWDISKKYVRTTGKVAVKVVKKVLKTSKDAAKWVRKQVWDIAGIKWEPWKWLLLIGGILAAGYYVFVIAA